MQSLPLASDHWRIPGLPLLSALQKYALLFNRSSSVLSMRLQPALIPALALLAKLGWCCGNKCDKSVCLMLAFLANDADCSHFSEVNQEPTEPVNSLDCQGVGLHNPEARTAIWAAAAAANTEPFVAQREDLERVKLLWVPGAADQHTVLQGASPRVPSLSLRYIVPPGLGFSAARFPGLDVSASEAQPPLQAAPLQRSSPAQRGSIAARQAPQQLTPAQL